MPLTARSHWGRLLMSANLDIRGPEIVNIVPRRHHRRLLLLSLFGCRLGGGSPSTVSLLPNKAVLVRRQLLIGGLLFGARTATELL